jgi:hypothetical protein
MADYEQIMRLAKDAAAAGDLEMARVLRDRAKRYAPSYGQAAQDENARAVLEGLTDLRPAEAAELQRLQAAQPANEIVTGEFGASMRGLQQGATLNWADEIGGMVKGDEYRDTMRAKDAAAEQAFPGQFAAGRTAGATGTGLATALATRNLGGPSIWGQMGAGFAVGGGEGTLYGGGMGTDNASRLAGAVKYGPVGAGLGTIAPAAVGLGSAAGRKITDILGGAVSAIRKTPSERRANNAIIETLERSGKDRTDIVEALMRAKQDGQPEFRLMDALGTAGQARANGLSRAGGQPGDDIAEYLRDRQSDAKDRVIRFSDEAFNLGGKTRAEIEKTVKTNRGEVFDALIKRAARDADPVDVTPLIAEIDTFLAANKAPSAGIKDSAPMAELKKMRARLAGKTPDGSDAYLSDFGRVRDVWIEYREKVDGFYKDQKRGLANAVKPYVERLKSQLEESSDIFYGANQNFSAGSDVLKSMTTGGDLLKKTRVEDALAAFHSLPAQQQRGAQIGFGDNIITDLQNNKAMGANATRPFNSTKADALSSELADDPGLLKRRLEREREMYETSRRVTGGSATATNLADMVDTDQITQAASAAANVATLNPVGMLGNLAEAVRPIVKGENEATRSAIAKILMSNDAAPVVNAMRQHDYSEVKKRLMEALMRNTGREPAAAAVAP